MTLLNWLTEPGTTHLAVAVLFAFVALCTLCALVSLTPALRRQQEADEQVINRSRRTHSGRKSGTVRNG